MFLWKAIASSGIDVGMSLPQMLTYTYINVLLSEMLIVRTFASSWNYEGKLIGLFSRPISVFGHIIAQTIGCWIQMLLMFSLPMANIAPLLGISIIPHTFWFFPSFLHLIMFCNGINPKGNILNGKSTTMKRLSGMLQPNNGEIPVLGMSPAMIWTTWRKWRREF